VHPIAVVSQKGGVGKTTLTLNLGFALAKRGTRTCVVDLDPQGAIGLSLTRKMAQRPGIVDWIQGRRKLAELRVPTRLNELSLIPVGKVPPLETHRFQTALEDGRLTASLVQELSHDDVVLIDTPSGFVGATMGAIRGSRHVLVPVQAEPIAARTLMRTFEVLRALEQEGTTRLLGLAVTMLQKTDPSSVAIAEDIWKSVPEGLVFQTSIPRDPQFLEASASGVPLGLLRRRPPAIASVFDVLAAEVEERLGLHGEEGSDVPVALVD
jgi:chromosome partitioning protein